MDRANIQTLLPLYGQQEALLMHRLRTGEDTGDLVTVEFNLNGKIDDATLDLAWQDVVARHDGLRATVQIPKTQKPMLVVVKDATLDIERHDFRKLSATQQHAAMAALEGETGLRGLALSAPPVSRLVIVGLADDRRRCLWTVSKTLMDGWSAIVVLRDMMQRYRSRREETADGLPAIPPLKAYSAFLKTRDESDAECFWARQFEGFAKREPLFRTGPGGVSASHMLETPAGLWTKVERAAAQAAVTPAAFVSAVWARFLAGLSACDDVAFAMSLSGRSFEFAGHDAMVGSFATLAPRRARILPGETIADLARRMHRASLAAVPHETLPPERIFGGTALTHAVPLPDTVLTIETLPKADLDIATDGGIALRGFRSGVASTFPVTIVFLPVEPCEIAVTTDKLLDAERAHEAISRFPAFLASSAEDPFQLAHPPAAAMPLSRGIAKREKRAKVVAPGDPMEFAVAEIWKDVLGIDDVDMKRDFVSHGGRSFAAMRVLTRIEKRFGTRIPIDRFIRAQTVPDLVALITPEIGKTEQLQTLVPFRRSGTRAPLLFVHLAPHPVTFLKPFFDRLDNQQPFFAVQPVGVGGEGEPHYSFESLAKLQVDEFLSVAPEGPVDLMGHCAGNRLAVEVARQLRLRGRDVRRIVVVDARPPFMRRQLDFATPTQKSMRSRFHRLKPWLLLRGAFRMTRRRVLLAWAEATRNTELYRAIRVEVIYRACIIANEAYRADPISEEIIVVHSNDSPENRQDWDVVSPRVRHVKADVGHYTMFFEPDVDALVDVVERAIRDDEDAVIIGTRQRRGAAAADPSPLPELF